jgi:hypothetical protein
MFTDVAAKLKKKGIKQVKRFNFRGNKISFNSAYCRVINFFNFRKYKFKNKTLLQPKKN